MSHWYRYHLFTGFTRPLHLLFFRFRKKKKIDAFIWFLFPDAAPQTNKRQEKKNRFTIVYLTNINSKQRSDDDDDGA